MPDIPCAAPFAAATPGDMVLYVERQTPPVLGFGPLRLLVRCKGSFIADQELRGNALSSSRKCKKVSPARLASYHCSPCKWNTATDEGLRSGSSSFGMFDQKVLPPFCMANAVSPVLCAAEAHPLAHLVGSVTNPACCR